MRFGAIGQLLVYATTMITFDASNLKSGTMTRASAEICESSYCRERKDALASGFATAGIDGPRIFTLRFNDDRRRVL